MGLKAERKRTLKSMPRCAYCKNVKLKRVVTLSIVLGRILSYKRARSIYRLTPGQGTKPPCQQKQENESKLINYFNYFKHNPLIDLLNKKYFYFRTFMKT